MANEDPKRRSIIAQLVENKLTEREDDFTANITHVRRRSIEDLCALAAKAGSKYDASELLANYNALKKVAKEELLSGATVEFGLCNNALGISGSLIGPSAKFDPKVNNVVIQHTTLIELKKDLTEIEVIINGVNEGQPTIKTVTDVFTQTVNQKLTPGNTLNGSGSRVKVVGTEGSPVGFFFIDATDETKVVPVPLTSISRNEPSNFSFIIPSLPDGKYYLEIATQYGGQSKKVLKDLRRNRFPYQLTVGSGADDRPEIE